MRQNRKHLTFSAEERRRLHLLAASGVELAFLEWTFGRSAAELEAALDDCRRAGPPIAAAPEPGGAAGDAGDLPPLPSPPLRCALDTLGERVTATFAGYALDDAPASIPDLIRAARAAGTRIPYPGIDPLPGSFATGPSVRPHPRRRPAPCPAG